MTLPEVTNRPGHNLRTYPKRDRLAKNLVYILLLTPKEQKRLESNLRNILHSILQIHLHNRSIVFSNKTVEIFRKI